MPFIKGNQLGKANKGRKGQIAWNKGLKTGLIPKTAFKKGEFENEKHPFWKGDGVSYAGLHMWIRRKLGKANHCEAIDCEGRSVTFQWANKSREYKRDLNDWLQLCRPCHMKYDNISKKIWITRRKRS